MKVNKRNPFHWLYLALFGSNVLAAILLRSFRSRRLPPVVVLYGHKLNGNLLAIYNRFRERELGTIDFAFLTMDPTYHRRLRKAGVGSVLAISPACIRLLARADAVVSDHGLHVLRLMLGRTSLKFFDVWHGIPFKGFDGDDFQIQHRFDEVWVASPRLKRLYSERFGFGDEQLTVTGYARTDRLVRPTEDRDAIVIRLGLQRYSDRKLVLFAPTWRQDDKGRAIYPFGLDQPTFLSRLGKICGDAGAALLVRAHLNTDSKPGSDSRNVVHVPAAQFPETEELLLISDVLICDWSSIAFDYLLLDRPTIFLDVDAPFAKGFSLGPEYRFGDIVTGMDALMAAVQHYLEWPVDYCARYGDKAAGIREEIYGSYADGEAARRCIDRLRRHL